jgi:hypothetical protein
MTTPPTIALWSELLAGAAPIPVPRHPGRLRRLAAELRARPPGTPVTIVDRGWWDGPWRWALARRAGLALEREFVAVPSIRAPLFLVERGAHTRSYFARRLLAVPPGVTLGFGPLSAALRVAGRWPVGVGLASAACGRVALWRRR